MCAAIDRIVHCNLQRLPTPGVSRLANAALMHTIARLRQRRAERHSFGVCNFGVCGRGDEVREFHAAVVGSIIFFTSVILVAGKPLISACLRMMASSLAR